MTSPENLADFRGYSIRVRGLVQGVGFRPTVARIAKDCELLGEVLNDGAGVLIRVWGSKPTVQNFLTRLSTEAPPLAQIDSVETDELDSQLPPVTEFKIVESKSGRVQTGVVPDAMSCPDCLAEVANTADRRFRYPFTNCTHCGPRLSIVRAIPYDRANTSMASFKMCKTCQSEYDAVSNRRFHAQPNACWECGPRLWLVDRDGKVCSTASEKDAIAVASKLILSGYILAIKGIGGFQLACDAQNESAVARLRQRKRRYDKPFAMMARDTDMVGACVAVGPAERIALESRHGPIVVMEKLGKGSFVAPSVAPGQHTLGFMLPNTPLHYLLLNDLGNPIVLTSGNRSDEPQVVTLEGAHHRLATIADYWLTHDRDIINRLDDSVVRVMASKPRILRRARGYAPAPIQLPPGFEDARDILAMGGELKNTFCLIKDGQAILSQHIGDLKDPETHKDFRTNLSLYQNLYDFHSTTVVVDQHPDYLSTQWGISLAQEGGKKIQSVQHHHAHIASAMTENGIPFDSGKVLGVALDGTGLGPDGTLWGGEFLAVDYLDFRRLAHFQLVPLPGGSKAIDEPWRTAFSYLETMFGWDWVAREYSELEFVQYLQRKPLNQLTHMMEKGLNTPLSSSAGRLFDAIAVVVGLCRDCVSYEGQAAIELEALAMEARDEKGSYLFDLEGETPIVVGWERLWRLVLLDLKDAVPATVIAARFHNTLIKVIAELAARIASAHSLSTIVLSGGSFQNKLLLEGVSTALEARGQYTVLTHRLVPANDGGLSLGQAAIAAARELRAAHRKCG